MQNRVAQSAEQLVQIVYALAAGEGEDVVHVLHVAAVGDVRGVFAQKRVNHVVVNQAEGERRHAGMLEERQQLIELAGKQGAVVQHQRLIDAVGDFARLRQDVAQVDGDERVFQHAAVVHDKAVVVGGRGFEVARGRVCEILVRVAHGDTGVAVALDANLVQRVCHVVQALLSVGENDIEEVVHRRHFDRADGYACHAVQRLLLHGEGLVVLLLFGAEHHAVIRLVDVQPDARGGGDGEFAAVKAPFHETQHEVMPLHGQGGFETARQVAVAAGQLLYARLDG